MDIKELKDLMDAQEGRLVKKIDEVIDKVEEQNHRIGKSEDAIIIASENCRFIQNAKEKRTIRNRWIIGTLLVVIGLISGMAWKVKENTKVPVELIYQKTDSTYVFPNLYFRSEGENKFKEIHQVFVDLKNDK